MKMIYKSIFNAEIMRVISELLKIEEAVVITVEKSAWKIVSESRERF